MINNGTIADKELVVDDACFFRGVVRQPGGDKEIVVIPKANQALAERIASKAAAKRGWDWVVEPIVEVQKD